MRMRVIAAAAATAVVVAWAASSASAVGAGRAAGSSTAFSFSGTLSQPNGSYDFQYQAFTASTGGSSVAGPVIVSNVTVTGSKYATRIDFGTDPFTGAARFLQIGWRPHGSGSFTLLANSVELVAVPYALGLRLPAAESTSAGGDALQVTNTGSGNALEADATTGTAVWGQTSTGDPAVLGRNTSSGAGVEGLSLGGTGTGAVYGYSLAGGAGVYGENDTGSPGVQGVSLGSGPGGFFRGSGDGNDPAIELANGGVKMDGAGFDTPTPVFMHEVTNADLCNNGHDVVLNNPYLNGQPQAIPFVSDIDAGPVEQGHTLLLLYDQPGGNGCPAGRWDLHDDRTAFVAGETFAFFVISPSASLGNLDNPAQKRRSAHA